MIPLRDVIPSRTTPVVTIALILVTTLVFLYQQTLDDAALHGLVATFGLVPAQLAWTNVVTSLFLHGGWGHLAATMLYLWIFGNTLEDRVGHGRFLLFYGVCGAAAAFGQMLAAPLSWHPVIGASGAISGVLGAYFVMFPGSRVLALIPLPFFVHVVEIPAVILLGLWVLLQLLSGVGSPGDAAGMGGMALWAHAAGFLSGVTAIFALRRPERQRVEWWDPIQP